MEVVLKTLYFDPWKKLSSMKTLARAGLVAQKRRPLLIIAEDIEGRRSDIGRQQIAWHTECRRCQAPGFGDRQKMLEDIAILSGGQAISEISNQAPEGKPEDLGQAKKVMIDKDKTIIVEGKQARRNRGSR